MDRARFLALVGSIAASAYGAPACNTSSSTPPDDAGATDDASLDAEMASDARASDARASDAKAVDGGCEDDDGIAPEACGPPFIATPAPRCASHDLCTSYTTHFKSRVARNALACLRAGISADASCIDCAREALGKACPDPSAATVCTEAAAICNDAGKRDSGGTSANCAAAAAGLTAGGRYTLLSCMTESACAYTLDYCLANWR